MRGRRRRSSAAFAAADGVLPGRFVSRQHRGLRVLTATDPDLAFLSTITGVRAATVDAVPDVLARTPSVVLVQAEDDEVRRVLARAGFLPDGTRALALGTPGNDAGRPDAGGILVEEAEPDAFVEVLLDGYRSPPAVSRYLEVEHRLPGIRRFVARTAGGTVAAAAMSLHGGVAVLGGAATRPRQRNTGAQTALLHHRLHEATRSGCHLAVATVAPGTASARNLARAGFAVLPRPAWRHDPT